jgi:hypothetical protein
VSNSKERWWERVPRIVGGWGLASLTLWKFFDLGDAAELPTRATYILLIAFFAGMAHSTVTGIVLGQIGRLYSFVWRRGKERRSDEPPPPGTAVDMPVVDRRRR